MAARIPYDRLAGASFLWLLLPLACGARLWWFTANQAVWPDEAAYMLIAKSFAGLSDYEAPAARPVLLPLLWSGFYRLGLGEGALRATELLFAVASVWLVYALGRELYGRWVGGIAALLLSISPPHLFLSQRLLTDVPGLAAWLAVLFLASRLVATPGSRAAALLLGPAVVAMLPLRHAYVFALPVLLLFLVGEGGASLLRERRLWLAAALGGLVLAPWFVWITAIHGSPLAPWLELNAAASPAIRDQLHELRPTGLLPYLKWLPSLYLGPVVSLAFVAGLSWLAADVVRRQRGAELRRDLLLVVWLVVILSCLVLLVAQDESRYLFPLLPAVLLLAARTARTARWPVSPPGSRPWRRSRWSALPSWTSSATPIA